MLGACQAALPDTSDGTWNLNSDAAYLDGGAGCAAQAHPTSQAHRAAVPQLMGVPKDSSKSHSQLNT